MDSVASSTENYSTSSTSSDDRIKELEQRTRDLEGKIEDLQGQLQDRTAVPEGYWSPQQVANYLSVSKRTVERMIDAGTLDPVWVRSQRRFKPEAVQAHMRKHGTSKGTC